MKATSIPSALRFANINKISRSKTASIPVKPRTRGRDAIIKTLVAQGQAIALFKAIKNPPKRVFKSRRCQSKALSQT
ncbi:MAG: hypothetical protein ACI8Z9_000074 [Paraglaciecola sp.]|jgi:hypothetical protein